MSEEQLKKGLREKVFSILKAGQPSDVIPALFEIQSTLSNNLKPLVREPILYVFENQHDWESIMKCIKHWKGGLNKWTRDFYERMKKRFQQTPDSNLADHELIPEINKLVARHQAVYGKRSSIVSNLDKYLKKQEKEDDKNSVKSGQSIKSIQSIKPIQSVKSNPVFQTKPPMTFSMNSAQTAKPIQSLQTTKPAPPTQTLNSVQAVQDENSNQSISSVQSLKQARSLQTISSTLQGTRKTEGPKPELSKISRMTEHIEHERSKQKSNQKSTDLKQPPMTFNMVKKPNLGMLRREQNNNSNPNPAPKNPKRLTFGISDELRSNLRLSKPIVKEIEKKTESVEAKPQLQPKTEENKSNNQNINIVNNQPKPVQKKPEESLKPAAFDRKEEVPIPVRVNPIFTTERKQPNTNQPQNPQAHERSVSRSITPHKPLIQRKKIIMKKPTDYKPTVVSSDDSFEMDDAPNMISSLKEDDNMFFSDEKMPMQEDAVQEVQELKKQIQNENRQPSKDTRQNPQKPVEVPKKQVPSQTSQQMQQSRKSQKKLEHKMSSISQNIRQQSQIPHPSMIRRQDQLFSDYEMSLMGFNPRLEISDVNIYKIVKKLGFNLSEQHNNELDAELEEIRKVKASRPRRIKL